MLIAVFVKGMKIHFQIRILMCCLKMGLKLKVMNPQSDLHDIIYGIYYLWKLLWTRLTRLIISLKLLFTKMLYKAMKLRCF